MARMLSLVLLVILVLAVLVYAILDVSLSGADAISRSIAEIESAKAMQAQAHATQSAVNALGAVTILDKILQITALVLLILIVAAIFYILRQRQHLVQLQTDLEAAQVKQIPAASRWAPGPNAGWKKLESPQGIGVPTLQDVVIASLLANIAQNLANQNPIQVRPLAERETDGESQETWEGFIQ